MKEFEKWLKTECIKCGAKWGHCCNECNHDGEKRAWKAALEWVLTMKCKVYGGSPFYAEYEIPDWYVEDIEEELNEDYS